MSSYLPTTAGILTLLSIISVTAQSSTSTDQVVARFAEYMSTYAHEYAATISTERYTQGAWKKSVSLESDFGIVRVPGQQGWIGFRDVVSLNGAPVKDRSADRLASLLADAASIRTGSAATLMGQIADESAKHNIGTVRRTVNNPALVMEVFDQRHHSRMRFSNRGDATLEGVRVRRISFEERVRPTIIRSDDDRDAPISGLLWIDPGSGRLHRAEMAVRVVTARDAAGRHFVARVTVTFGPVTGMPMWVPLTMTEEYQAVGGSGGYTLQTGEATYSAYRRFRVETADQISPK
jgi:hypothetical protein